MKKNETFTVDTTPSWNFIAHLILAMLDVNTNINSKTRTNIKEQLLDMSRVADAYVDLKKGEANGQ